MKKETLTTVIVALMKLEAIKIFFKENYQVLFLNNSHTKLPKAKLEVSFNLSFSTS